MTGSQKLFVWAGALSAGVTFALAVMAFTLYWWGHRPRAWTEKALTGEYSELICQQLRDGIQLTFAYALTNSTEEDYTLPSGNAGALMRKNPDNESLAKIDGATWPSVAIPTKQKIEVRFTVLYKFADYSTSMQQLSKPLTPKEVLQDPNFWNLPLEERRKAMLQIAPDFKGLPIPEQNKILIPESGETTVALRPQPQDWFQAHGIETQNPDTLPADFFSRQRVLDFVAKRLNEIDGLVLFDFSKRYKVVLPQRWSKRDGNKGGKAPAATLPR